MDEDAAPEDEIASEKYTVEITTDMVSGKLLSESWMFDEKLTREFGPAYREYDKNSGRLKIERWMRNGIAHRPGNDFPSETIWDVEHNQIISRSFQKHGEYHRDHHRPARIFYSKNTGTVVREEFWQQNKLHRANNLPAIIVYDEFDGRILHQEFHHQGRKLNAVQFNAPKP